MTMAQQARAALPLRPVALEGGIARRRCLLTKILSPAAPRPGRHTGQAPPRVGCGPGAPWGRRDCLRDEGKLPGTERRGVGLEFSGREVKMKRLRRLRGVWAVRISKTLRLRVGNQKGVYQRGCLQANPLGMSRPRINTFRAAGFPESDGPQASDRGQRRWGRASARR